MLKQWLATLGMLVGSLGLLFSAGTAHAQDELKHITLSVFMYPIGSPSAFFKEDLHKLYGMDIDIVKELQNRLGFELRENRIFPIDYSQAWPKLDNGEIDFLGGGLSFTNARAAAYDCTPIYLNSSLGVIYSKDYNHFRSVNDLRGKKVGTDFKSASGEYLAYLHKFGAEPVEINNMSLALFMVAQGRLDAIVYDRMPIEDFSLSVEGAHLSMLSDEFGEEHARYTFYMPKNGPHNAILKQTLQEMLDDGTIDRFLRKWNIRQFGGKKGQK